jgi:peptide/nickel transport system substrate-binding protein
MHRRQALAMTGAGAAGALVLAACGGSSDNNKTTGQNSGLVTPPTDSTSKAKRGGVWPDSHTSDIQSFDPHFMSIPSSPLNTMTYSRLFKPEVGNLKPALTGSVVGDAVESYEFSPDKLQMTMKLRPNKWHSIAPVNGRAVDAEDIAFTFQRLSAVGTNRAFYAGSLGGPIDSVTATDSKTVVMKLNQVYAPLLAVFSTNANGNFYIVPRESENQNALDLRRTMVGSGPWALKDYRPSAGFTFRRHEGWYAADKLYVDELQMPIVTEYATGLAQFKAGRIYRYPVRGEDIVPAKRDNDQLKIYLGAVTMDTGFGFYGWNPALKTPFRDQRLRQAMSMSWDRDTWLNAFFGVDQLRADGLPMESRWATACNCGWEGWWLDPKGKEFGPNAKYYQYNVAEAKKLVAAAGFPSGLDAEVYHITTGEYGTDFVRYVETYKNFATEAGIRLKSVAVNYATEWKNYSDSKGDFPGMSFRGAGGNNAPDIPETMVRLLHPTLGGVTYTGFFSEGSSFQKGDPEITALLEKTRAEFDQQKRIDIINQVQRLHAERQYVIRTPGGMSTRSIEWPVIQNEGVFVDELRFVGQWLDPTQAPLGKS